MSLKREINYPDESKIRRRTVGVHELIKEIELITGIRKRIREGYYDKPEIMAEIGDQLRRRLEENS